LESENHLISYYHQNDLGHPAVTRANAVKYEIMKSMVPYLGQTTQETNLRLVHRALEEAAVDCLELLLVAGVDAMVPSEDGKTALHILSQKQNDYTPRQFRELRDLLDWAKFAETHADYFFSIGYVSNSSQSSKHESVPKYESVEMSELKQGQGIWEGMNDLTTQPAWIYVPSTNVSMCLEGHNSSANANRAWSSRYE
jgi:hypothetical protein